MRDQGCNCRGASMNYLSLGRAASPALLFLLAVSAPAAERHSLHTGVPKVAAKLKRIELLPATNRIRLAIGLPLRNQSSLTNLFHQLYSPNSTNFHHFLTPAQFVGQFGPTEQEYRSVM